MNLIIIIFTVIIFSYLSLLLYLYIYQRKIVFKPSKIIDLDILSLDKDIKEIVIISEGNIKCQIWYKKSDNNNPTILYFHGNKGNLGNRANKFKELLNQDFGLLAISYQGYGNSEGKPSESGLYNNALSALNYLKSQDINLENIIFYGESLGTGVAIELASHYSPKLLALEAPYTSMLDLAHEKYPLIPIHLLLKDKFDSLSKIDKITCPVIIFHGKKDPTIPFHHSERLMEKIKTPKIFHIFNEVSHIDFNHKELAKIIRQFVDK